MGLKVTSGPTVKNVLLDTYPNAFTRHPHLFSVVNERNAKRKQAFLCIDGDVMLKSMPKSVCKFDEVVRIVRNRLMSSIATAALTVVVFDEPDAVPAAKKEEQNRRDAGKGGSAGVTCSSDIMPATWTDFYTLEQLRASTSVRQIAECRASRMRLYDAVIMDVLPELKATLQRWGKKRGRNEGGGQEPDDEPCGGAIIFDGIDRRGASRGAEEVREAGIVSSDEAVGRLFVREQAIGEGDLKLPAVRLQHAALVAAGAIPPHVMASPTSEAPHVAVCVTIDSDAYPIELIRHGTHGAVGGVHLALYERSTEKDKPGSYLVCSVGLLHQKILERTWGVSRASTLALTDQRATMTMFAAAWSLCGCDFIHPFGMRVKQAESAVLTVLRGREARRALDAMATVWSDSSAAPTAATATACELVEAPAVKILQYIAELTAREMRSAAECRRVREATLTRVGDPGDAVLLRALWVASYWNNVLHRNAAAFGFGLSSA